MKKSFILLALALTIAGCSKAESNVVPAAEFYTNPIIAEEAADPFILKAKNGKYYLYGTSMADDGFEYWTSTDMVNWESKGVCYEKNDNSFGVLHFWAPEIVEHKGKYYLFYSACWRENFSLRIGVAVSNKPGGPFKDISDEPLFDFGYAAIDASVFKDDDGQYYLYYSRDCSENVVDGRHESHIYAIKLADNLKSVVGEPVLVLKPEQEWEFKSGDWRWNEGPAVIKHNNLYYLMFSANFYDSRDYAVGYATSDSPMGPFSKYEDNPIMYADKTEVSGTGHNSIVKSPSGEELFIVYHGHENARLGSGVRFPSIDRMGFTDEGVLYVNGPTIDRQPAPK